MAKISINLTSGTVAKSSVVIGIDLGTTNSLIASIEETSRMPYCITKDEASIVPSVLHISNDAISIGQSAINKMVDEPENTIYSIKRLMGKSYQDVMKGNHKLNYEIVDNDDKLIQVRIEGRLYSPTELSSYILKELKNIAELKLNTQISKVVITVPAYFNDSQRQATRDAGKLAGLDVLRIINEPTAASLAYGLGQDTEKPRTVAVYDLGGGTFDISILSIQDGIFEVLATNGDTSLGGDDFDQQIVNFWQDLFNLENLSKNEKQSLRLTAENAKKILGESGEFHSVLLLGGKNIPLSLNIKQLNELINPLVCKTLICSQNALKDAELRAEDIDEIVLVGGSTKTVFVKEKVSKLFMSAKVNNNINPDEVVALGAAIEADILAGNRTDMLLLDVTPLSLGIETLGGMMDVLIPRNNKIPTKLRKEYTTSVDGQVNLAINVYQGEREMVADNRKLGEFILQNIPSMPAGMPKIEMTFMLNADGILQVSAEEKRSGVQQQVEMKPQYGITDDEIKSMLKASIDNAESDMKTRSLAEAIAEGDQLIYATDKFINQNAHLLTSSDIDGINKHVQILRQAVNAKDRNLIVTSTEELNNFSRQFAEKAMDEKIAKALQGKKID
ncbi:MAG: heat-shock protein Hsp70 [Bacteroidetes bacterium]|nr:MAG: heat-shock protein Hsp70 [Bacteroidota bacterium]